MKAEHWECEFGHVIFDENNPSRHFLVEKSIFCCIIEGHDWDDIMTKYHKHMNWEPYVSMTSVK